MDEIDQPCTQGPTTCNAAESGERHDCLDHWNKAELELFQGEDSVIGRVITWLRAGSRPKREEITHLEPAVGSFWSQFGRLKLMDGLLFREYESEDGSGITLQLCLPRKLIPEVLKLLHDSPTAGHLGVSKTAGRVTSRFYWNNWMQDVEDHCRSCEKCAQRNAPSKHLKARLVTNLTGYPMQRVALDVVGPLPKSRRGNRFILVVSDYFTRWPEAYAIVNHEATTVAQKLIEEWVSRYGIMQNLHSDQGREFESKVFQSMCRMLGVNKTRTTPYHPQSDGMVERYNRTLKDMLSKVIADNQNDWDEWLPHVLLAYRTAVHSSTGVTPHRMLFGREARIPVDILVEEIPSTAETTTNVPTYVQKTKAKLQRAHEIARTKNTEEMRRYKDYYDSRVSGQPYHVGDKVWLYQPTARKGISKKLGRPWEGPYTVVKVISEAIYRIKKNGTGRKRVVAHFNRLKPCFTPAPERTQGNHARRAHGEISMKCGKNGRGRRRKDSQESPNPNMVEVESTDDEGEATISYRKSEIETTCHGGNKLGIPGADDDDGGIPVLNDDENGEIDNEIGDGNSGNREIDNEVGDGNCIPVLDGDENGEIDNEVGDENSGSREIDNEVGDENGEVDTDVCVENSEANHSAGHELRPTRTRRTPAWMDDYIT